MKKLILTIIGITLFGCMGCNTEGKKLKSVVSDGMELLVEPGEYWLGKMKVFIFSLDRTPQMAAWLEDDRGNYISTIIVTDKGAKGTYKFAPKEGRPESLPVWYHKKQDNKAQIDSVSAATSKSGVGVQINNSLLTNGQEYHVYLEINNSFDFNETWPEKKNDVNGQPSIIYHAKFIAGTAGKTDLSPIGHGAADGSDGKITNELGGITTALGIIKNACIKIN